MSREWTDGLGPAPHMPGAATGIYERRGKTLMQRMPWIKCEVSDKDSLAARDNHGQLASVLAATQRSTVMPVSFFTDLAGKQRCIKASFKSANNPFLNSRNPLPLGFGLDEDAAARASTAGLQPQPAARGQSAAATSRDGRDSRALGVVVQQLVAMDVEEAVARRAVQASACHTVAEAMKWILNHEPAAVGELEARWLQRTVRARSSRYASGEVRNDHCGEERSRAVPRTFSAQKRSAAAERFLAKKQGSGAKGAAAQREQATPSDVGSIHINLPYTSSCASSHRANLPSKRNSALSRPQIWCPDTPPGCARSEGEASKRES
jgi:hypothetical protein